MRSELTQQELSRLNMTQLLDYGRQALKSGDYDRAASLFREAVHRAPMRQDLKDYLGMAVEGTLIEHAPPARRAPQPPAGRERQAPPPQRPQSPPGPRPSGAAPPRPAPQDRPAPPGPAPRPAPNWDMPERRPSLPPPGDPRQPMRPPQGAQRPELPRFERPETRPEPAPKPPFEDRAPRPASRPDGGRPADFPVFHPEPRFPGRPARSEEPWFHETEPLEPPPSGPRPRLPRDPRGDNGAPAPLSEPAPRLPRSRPELPPPPGYAPQPMPPRAQPPQLYKPHPRPIDFNRRHQRGPLSAIFVGAFAGMLMFLLLGGLAWFYLDYSKKFQPGPKKIDNTADLNLAIERAQAFTRKDEYSKAIDILQAQPDSLRRNQKLAEMYNEQGDQQLLRQKPPRYDSAIDNYAMAIKFDPDNWKYRNNLADAYFQLAVARNDDAKASEEALAKAGEQCDFVLRQDPKNLGTLDILKRLAIRRRDDAMLARTLNQIIAADPDSPRAAEARQMLEERKLR